MTLPSPAWGADLVQTDVGTFLLARSPAPLVHAATKAVRKAFYDAHAWFVATFQEAAERLCRGDREAPFVAG